MITENCSGCHSCLSVCKTGAITMEENEEGFLFPKIDEQKCIHCGLCKRVCEKLDLSNFKNPESFVCRAKDEIRLSGSSSGGVFPVLANYVLDKKGVVFGASWTKDFEARHIFIEKKEDIPLLQGSKYIQSEISDSYILAKNFLDQNRLVLFTGTPCQIGGLKNYLTPPRKNYDNLILMDLICHAVSSKKVLKKYLNESFDNKVKRIDLRSKIMGWKKQHVEIYLENETIIEKARDNLFMKTFLKDLSNRRSCYDCKYQTIPRQGDITAGDFWGIKNEDDDKKGTSIILVNSKIGEEVITNCKKEFKYFKRIPLEDAISSNKNLVKSLSPHKNRDLFFQNLDKMSLKENINRTIFEYEKQQLKLSLLNKIFCVKNLYEKNVKRKLVCILGLKFKIRCK